MSLPIEEIDDNKRAIFFKSPADISKSIELENGETYDKEHVNRLYQQNRLPLPKFQGFVYNYSRFLTLCSRDRMGQQKVKHRVEYNAIADIFPCDFDSSVIFMIVASDPNISKVRVFRFQNATLGTKFRYVIDQLQLNPVHESPNLKTEYGRNTVNSGSSFSNPMTEESENSVTSAAQIWQKSASFNPTMQKFYNEEEEALLPRVQAFTNRSIQRSSTSQSRRSRMRQRSDIFVNFDPTGYEIYKPTSRLSRLDRVEPDYATSQRAFRSRPSRSRAESRGSNFNSRPTSRNSRLQDNTIYVDPDLERYKAAQYNYDSQPRSRSASNRYAYY